MPSGTKAYFEHVGPLETDTALLVVGKDDAWKMHGHIHNTVTIRGMNPANLGGTRKRPMHVEFADGGQYYFTFPTFEMDGALSSKRIVRIKGAVKVYDKVNKISSVVSIVEPESEGTFGGWFGSKKETNPEDINRIEVSIL